MILIITIGSKNVGYGHLSRSILIQNKIRKKSEIFIFNENQKIIDLKKKKVISFKEASFKLFERKIIICDFANRKIKIFLE